MTGRVVFVGVDVSGKVRLFGEQETNSSRRIRFSSEAENLHPPGTSSLL